jgi:nucleoside-diphosphate-sugar epimerase
VAGKKTGQSVLVTGHAGYIGQVMVQVLEDAGHAITGCDTGYYEGCDFGRVNHRIPNLRKDVRELSSKDLLGFESVIHLAALSNDPLGDLDPELTLEINYRASVRLARLARDVGIKRFLFSSSCSMYGSAGDEILAEAAPLRPITAYAESKVRAEEELDKLATHNFSPVYLRNATAYGASPRLRADLVLNNLCCWGYTTNSIRIMSDGTPWRPLVHVEDISRAFAAVLEAPTPVIHNRAFNVGRDCENYQVRDLAEIVRQVMPRCQVEYAGKGGPDPRNYRVDFTRISGELPSWQPRWNARMGAEQLIQACRQNGMAREDFEGWRFTRLNQLRQLMTSGRIDPQLRWREVSYGNRDISDGEQLSKE